MSPDWVVHFRLGAAEREHRGLATYVPTELLRMVEEEPQRGVPAIAKDPRKSAVVEAASALVPSTHRLAIGDSRDLSFLDDESVHLVVTSPPYWTLKEYEPGEGQLGYVEDYED